jgi:cytosine deaminase
VGAGYQIPRVVIGENVTSKGAENSLRAGGAQVGVLQDEECIRMIREFIAKLSNEDIGA